MNNDYPTWWGKMPIAEPSNPMFGTFLTLAEASAMMDLTPWKFATFQAEDIIRSVCLGEGQETRYLNNLREVIRLYPLIISPPFKKSGGESLLFSKEFLIIEEESSIALGIIPRTSKFGGEEDYLEWRRDMEIDLPQRKFPPIHYYVTASLMPGGKPFRLLKKRDFQQVEGGSILKLTRELSVLMDKRISTAKQPLEYVFGKRRPIVHDLLLLRKVHNKLKELELEYYNNE